MTDTVALIDIPLACDCHMHIFDNRFPLMAKSPLAPSGNATADAYKAVRQALGLERCVIVQPSGYALDNRCTLDALQQLGDSARGVAVVNESVSDEALQEMDAAGVRGIRFNLVQAGATDVSSLEPMARRVSELGWHLQIHCHTETLREVHGLLMRLPVPVVLDHMGLLGRQRPRDEASFKVLLKLLESGRVWAKLSGPYLNGWKPNTVDPELGALVKDLVTAAEDRLVWGSDWPHLTESVQPDDEEMIEAFQGWIGNASTWAKILRTNPEKLYGFDSPA